MKIGPNKSRRGSAFTLTELAISMALGLMILGGTLACSVFCTRLMEITQSKIVTSDKARQIGRLFISDVSAAQTLRIGNGGLTQFTVTSAAAQTGTALQIYPSSDTNVFIRYYVDVSEKRLMRLTNNSVAPHRVASFVTNANVFAAEDFAGNVLTSPQNHSAISMVLQFDKLEDSAVPMGNGQHYRAYQLRTKATYRAL